MFLSCTFYYNFCTHVSYLLHPLPYVFIFANDQEKADEGGVIKNAEGSGEGEEGGLYVRIHSSLLAWFGGGEGGEYGLVRKYIILIHYHSCSTNIIASHISILLLHVYCIIIIQEVDGVGVSDVNTNDGEDVISEDASGGGEEVGRMVCLSSSLLTTCFIFHLKFSHLISYPSNIGGMDC